MPDISVTDIAKWTEGRLVGDESLIIQGLATLEDAQPGQLTFINHEKYLPTWNASKATVAVLDEKFSIEPGDGRCLVYVKNTDLAIARILEEFAPPPALPELGIHPTASIASDAQIGDNVRIAEHCVIRSGVTIGEGTSIDAGCFVGEGSSIGKNTIVYPHVTIRERCHIGDHCILHSQLMIGGDGFGYRPEMTPQGPRIVKMPHVGGVRIGHAVEIGCQTAIDRGKFDDTVIGDQSKIDNLCQIAHNVKIGRLVIIAGCTALGGSSVIGDGTMIGGCSAIRDHVKVGAQCQIAGGAVVKRDVPSGEAWAGFPAKKGSQSFRELAAISKLPETLNRMRQLEALLPNPRKPKRQ